MTFIVNGASGFVGRALVEHLAQGGSRGWAVSRAGVASDATGWTGKKREEVLAGDGLGLPTGSPCLVHLEVKHHVPNPTSKDLATFRKVNVDGLRRWLTWCGENGIHRVISFSSIKAVAARESVIDETAMGPGDSPYGASKWEAEQVLAKWVAEDSSRSGLVLRPAVIYGPGNLANMYSFVEAIHRGRFFLVGSSENVKSLVSLRNVVSSVSFLANLMEPGCTIYNLVDAESFSVSGLARMIRETLGSDRSMRSLPVWCAKCCALVGDVIAGVIGRAPLTSQRLKALTETTAFSSEKLKRAGFVHPQTTQEGLGELVDWYLKEGKNKSGIHN